MYSARFAARHVVEHGAAVERVQAAAAAAPRAVAKCGRLPYVRVSGTLQLVQTSEKLHGVHVAELVGVGVTG